MHNAEQPSHIGENLETSGIRTPAEETERLESLGVEKTVSPEASISETLLPGISTEQMRAYSDAVKSGQITEKGWEGFDNGIEEYTVTPVERADSPFYSDISENGIKRIGRRNANNSRRLIGHRENHTISNDQLAELGIDYKPGDTLKLSMGQRYGFDFAHMSRREGVGFYDRLVRGKGSSWRNAANLTTGQEGPFVTNAEFIVRGIRDSYKKLEDHAQGYIQKHPDKEAMVMDALARTKAHVDALIESEAAKIKDALSEIKKDGIAA